MLARLTVRFRGNCFEPDLLDSKDDREFLATVHQSARLGKTVLTNKLKVLLGSLVLAATPFVQAQGAPFVCDATAYSIATGQLATAAYSVTTGIVSAETPLGTPWTSGVAPAINSLAYNYQDNYPGNYQGSRFKNIARHIAKRIAR